MFPAIVRGLETDGKSGYDQDPPLASVSGGWVFAVELGSIEFSCAQTARQKKKNWSKPLTIELMLVIIKGCRKRDAKAF